MKTFIFAIILSIIALQFVHANTQGTGVELFSMYKTSDCSSNALVNITLNTIVPVLAANGLCLDVGCAALGSMSFKAGCGGGAMPTEAPAGTLMISYYGAADATCSASAPMITGSFSVGGLDQSMCVQIPALPDGFSVIASKISFFDFKSLKINGCGNIKSYTDTACSAGEKTWPTPSGLCASGYKLSCTAPTSDATILRVSSFIVAIVALLFFAF